jgi:hypothetical protein
MNAQVSRMMMGLVVASMPLFAMGCGGGSSNSSSPTTPQTAQNGSVNLMVSDASTEDWATIGVKVLSIALTPQGGGSPVTVYTAPSPAPTINLVQLDQLSEILGNVSVAAGTYTGATLTISANSGDVLLTVSADPETGFAGTAGATIPSSQIQIMGTTGSAGSLTVPVSVNFVAPLVVTASQSNALDLEFDLSHPAFLVAHVPPTTGTTIWAVNFNGPVRPHRLADIEHVVLRHIYGTAGMVSSDNSNISVTRDFPVEPPTSPETEITSTQNLTIYADGTNGTIYYDVDAGTQTTIMNFSSIASTISGKFVRVAARYQSDGDLVAVRMWASSSFNSIWISPEGHVLHVNDASDVITVENELGAGVPLTVNTNTQFFFRTPANPQADATPVNTGTAFLADIVRGFKVHVSAVDPLASPLVAQTIEIETARYDGDISAANTAGFTYTRDFHTATDDYVLTLPYISSSSANGADPLTGNAVTGFKFWNFTFPTIVTSGTGAISAYESATNGTANFGGTAGAFPAVGESFATWNDPIAPNAWAVPWTVLLPSTVPVGTAATSYSTGSSNGSFTMMVPGGTLAVTVNLSTTMGSGTLVYQIDRTANVVTISSVDITTSTGQTTVTNALVAGAPVKVFGVPQANGSIDAYVVFYYTGMAPAPTS